MSCIIVEVARIGNALTLDVSNLGGIEASTSLYGEYIAPIVSEIGNHLNVSYGLVCDIYSKEVD